MSKIQLFTPDEDSQLLLSWHRGDLSAFETLVWKYQKRIFNLAILLTGDLEAAATATENSFLTAYQDIRSLTGKSRFSTWLVAITLKECRNLNYFRAAESPPSEIPALAGLQDVIDSINPSAMMKKLAFCLKDLSVELTEVILLRYVRGYSLEKLEEIFQIRAEVLLSRLFEAEEALTACLKSGLNRSDDISTPHPEIRRNFSAYLDNSADNAEKVLTKEHLKSCGSCREALADLEWMIEHLKSLPDEEPPAWLTSSIMQKTRSIPKKQAEVKRPSYLAIQVTAGMFLLAIIGFTGYLLTTGEETAKPGNQASRIGSSAAKSDSGKSARPEEPTSPLKGIFRGAGPLEDKKPKAVTTLPSSSGSSPQGNPPAALPALISPPARTEQPTAPLKAEPPQNRERAEKPQLPSEWGDIQTQSRTPQKKTPAPRRSSGELAVVLTASDPSVATQEIETAVTSLGGKITGRAYSNGNDILYTRIEVEKLIELIGRLRTVGKLQELPDLPENAEGTIDLVIKW
ncbi:MAG TPA: zf-HC2 domain-containing protein [Geobacteraceae bacterium]|nr:zf-HC2 domain-containing protein [Geobacteraceae bacterium]